MLFNITTYHKKSHIRMRNIAATGRSISFKRGHEIYYPTFFRYSKRKDTFYQNKNENPIWRYADNDALFKEEKRPCIRCNNYATDKGHDYCIKNLPGVRNACCGHGVKEGYIAFEDGTVIRGQFEVERSKSL